MYMYIATVFLIGHTVDSSKRLHNESLAAHEEEDNNTYTNKWGGNLTGGVSRGIRKHYDIDMEKKKGKRVHILRGEMMSSIRKM